MRNNPPGTTCHIQSRSFSRGFEQTDFYVMKDAARDLAEEGDEPQSDEEYPAAATLRRASAGSLQGGGSPLQGGATPEEVVRFGAAKERKHLRAAGVAAFNR